MTRSSKITIVPIGDIHKGAKAIDIQKLKDLVEFIRITPDCYWIGMGDYVDAINYSDKRFNPKDVDQTKTEFLNNLVADQVDEIVDIFMPIKHKCIGMLGGNHEETIAKRYHQDILSMICSPRHGLGVENLTYTVFMDLIFDRGNGKKEYASQSVKLFACHGAGGGGSVGGQIGKISKMAQFFDADIFIMGHVHNKLNMDGEKFSLSKVTAPGQMFGDVRLMARKQLFALTGSFLHTYGNNHSPYSETKMYSPIPTGAITITIEPFREVIIDGKQVAAKPHIHMSV